MTSDFRRKMVKRKIPEKERRSSITPKDLDHNDPEEDIAMKFFPNDNARK